MPASITLTVSHLPSSTSFFLSCLQPLNYVYRGRVNDTIGFGHPDAPPDFWIKQSVSGVPLGPAHVAFPALSQRHVHEFFMNGLKAGGKVHGEPALRDIATGYYCAAIIDLDGNSIEAVYRADLAEKSKENVADPSKSATSTAKSTTKSKAPTVVSSVTKASKAKTVAASEVRSVAPSATTKSTVSKAQSRARSVTSSATPLTSISRAPTQAQSIVPPASTVSKAPTPARSVATSAAPPSSTSRAPSNAPRGDIIDNLLSEAKGTIAMAKQLVDQARPHLTSSDTAKSNGSSDSHGPSDAIVGTLLGVAAGAALHYALSNRSRNDGPASAPAQGRNSPPIGVPRSETAPSYTEERYHYYHGQPESRFAIEAAPSSYRGSQRLIEMIDNDPTVSEYTSPARPRRRRSASEVSATRTGTTRNSWTTKLMLEAPPTSYRPPTASTQVTRKTGRSRASSATRIPTGGRQDEGYASASESRSRLSRHTSHSKQIPKSEASSRISSHSHHRSSTTSAHQSAISASKSQSPSNSHHSSPSTHQSVITAFKSPSQHPLPPSRAATWTGSTTGGRGATTLQSDDRSFFSTHSKPSKTVIGRLTEKQLHQLERNRGLDGVTRSVVGKVGEVDDLNVSSRELKPSDSVSQVSSSRGSRRG